MTGINDPWAIGGVTEIILIVAGVGILAFGLSFRFLRDHHKYNQWKREQAAKQSLGVAAHAHGEAPKA